MIYSEKRIAALKAWKPSPAYEAAWEKAQQRATELSNRLHAAFKRNG